MKFFTLVHVLSASSALGATLKIGDLAQGSEFTKCIKVTDFNTKSLNDEVEVVDRVDGCCPEGYIPGIKHYTNYWGAMVVCGFKDDGAVQVSLSSSNSKKTCTYNKCYVVKMDITCKDSSKMTLDGCCPKNQYTDTCKSYRKSASFFKEKVEYCLSYQKKYKLEGTADKTDDQVTADGATTLSLTNLRAYTVCPGGWGGGSGNAYETVGDAACVDDAKGHGTGALKFTKSTDKGDACKAACNADSSCTGYDDRASGCVYYKIKIASSNAAATNYKCYRKVTAASGTSAPSTASASGTSAPSTVTGAFATSAPSGGAAGSGPSCDDATIKPAVDALIKGTYKDKYKSCNEEKQTYTLEVSGYETTLNAGRNGNSNKYGLGQMCVGGTMYYIYTKDTAEATWNALKASPPDESGVIMKCKLGEGSAGDGDATTTDSAMRVAVSIVAVLSTLLAV